MASRADEFLETWHRIVAERDAGAIPGVLADDVELGAPPYWNQLRGKELVAHLLGLILEIVEGFRYRREWCEGDELALEFRGRVGELELQGIDLISLDAHGRIRRLDVLMRPINAIAALRDAIAPRMTEFLAGRGGG